MFLQRKKMIEEFEAVAAGCRRHLHNNEREWVQYEISSFCNTSITWIIVSVTAFLACGFWKIKWIRIRSEMMKLPVRIILKDIPSQWEKENLRRNRYLCVILSWVVVVCNHISSNCYQIPQSIRSWKLVPATQLTVNYSQSHSNLKLNSRHQKDRKLFNLMLSSYVEIHSIFLFPLKRYQVFMLWSYSVNNSDTNYTFLGRHLITHLLLLIQIWSFSHAIIEMAELSTLSLLVTQN